MNTAQKGAGVFSFTLYGQLPSGKNAVLITRTGKRYPAPRFKAWRDEALRQLGTPLPHFTGPVHLYVAYFPGDQRRRDLPGMLDAILHVLEKSGIVEDDAQITSTVWGTMKIDRENPRCFIQLTENEEAS